MIKGITSGGGNDGNGSDGNGNVTNTAGFSPLIILALIGAGAAFFLKRKK
jgi:LPXTG-motif cell wall-anchored protein